MFLQKYSVSIAFPKKTMLCKSVTPTEGFLYPAIHRKIRRVAGLCGYTGCAS